MKNTMARVVGLGALLAVSVCGQEADTENGSGRRARFELQISGDDADDIAERIGEQLEQIEENLNERVDDLRDEVAQLRNEFTENPERSRRCADDEKSCSRKGASGSLDLQFLRLDAGPLRDLVRQERTLRNRQFDFGDARLMPMIGFSGFYDQGNGIRIGQGVWCGYKRFQSSPYSTAVLDTLTGQSSTVDSIVILRSIPVHAGFLLEKAFTFENWSVNTGAMLGGGAQVVISQFRESSGAIFLTNDTDDSLGSSNQTIGATVATFLAWDVHAGMSIRLAPAFSLGVDGVVLFNYSPEGFGRVSGDYLSVNPGVRLRLTFGKSS